MAEKVKQMVCGTCGKGIPDREDDFQYCKCKKKLEKETRPDQIVDCRLEFNEDTGVMTQVYFITEARTCKSCNWRGPWADFMGDTCDWCIMESQGGPG